MGKLFVWVTVTAMGLAGIAAQCQVRAPELVDVGMKQLRQDSKGGVPVVAAKLVGVGKEGEVYVYENTYGPIERITRSSAEKKMNAMAAAFEKAGYVVVNKSILKEYYGAGGGVSLPYWVIRIEYVARVKRPS